MEDKIILGMTLKPVVYVPALYFILVGGLLVLKKLFYRKIRDLAKYTTSDIDDIFLDALEKPLIFIILISSLYVLQSIFGFGLEGQFLKTIDVIFKVAAIAAVMVFLDKFVKGLIKGHAEKVPVLKSSQGMVLMGIRGLVVAVGALVVLDSIGVSITPILASLGVGSLAVALALQPTLENFFSGVQLIADKPIELGQFIKLESGEEGYVEKIGWRSTWIRMLPNNMIIIPNKVLVNSRVLNYHYPETELAVLVDAGVHYDSDLERVEKVTLEVAEETLKSVEGAIASFKPVLRYHTLADSSINFTVILRAKEFAAGPPLKHEFIKRLRKRYAAEGIVIPYPIRTLDWNEGSGPVKVAREEQQV